MSQTTRRAIVGGMAALAGAAVTPLPSTAGPTPTTFLGVGDWGRNGSQHQSDVAAQMEKAAAERNAAFVVSVGDNFYDNGVQSTTDPLWTTSFETIYTGPHLQVPWYVALGNHDYHGNPQAQVDYSRLSPRWKMPSRYFKIAGTDIGFPAADLFIVDTSPLVHEYAGKSGQLGDNVKSQDTAAQLAWLDRELGASTATHKLVLGHHTLFSGGSGHGDSPEMKERVLPVLKRHSVLAYINGHDHDMQHIIRDGLNVICTGAGSEVRPVRAVQGTQFCVSRSGFSIFTLSEAGLDLEFRDYQGQTLYQVPIHQA